MIQTPLKKLLLNCDMGESFGSWRMGNDEVVMPLVDMANIACGFHASDPSTMDRTVRLAAKAGVSIGAHPSYPDLVGFGRRSLQCTHDEIVALLRYQAGALDGICRAHGVQVDYIKPHGALYNDMMREPAVFEAVLEGVAGFGSKIPLVLLASADSRSLQAAAKRFSVPLLFEAFADRAYTNTGRLLPRSEPGAVYCDPAAILKQSLLLAREQKVIAQDGSIIKLQVDTLCVHGDNEHSLQAINAIRTALDEYYEPSER